ncbi:hypothetical protein ACFRAQ_03385 [Nocardia sp. NPDC056611]|uniref:hypothetical protein n=1 Tax=Nocardia sp. NPDC056611 TaxID=3345877 RepID=UPI00366F64CF
MSRADKFLLPVLPKLGGHHRFGGSQEGDGAIPGLEPSTGSPAAPRTMRRGRCTKETLTDVEHHA